MVIKNVTSAEPCRLHAFRDGGVKIIWPEELARFFAQRGKAETAARLAITSPRGGASYTLAEGTNRLILEAAGGEGPLYWFVDGEYIGSTEDSQTVAWTMTPGAHLITAADGRGSAAKAKITVKDPKKSAPELPTLEALN